MSPNETMPQLSKREAEEMYERLATAASRRRRERTVIRVAGTAVSVVLVLTGLIWATVSLIGLHGGTTPGANPNEQPPNYLFEDVRAIYPFIDPRAGEADPSRAGIEGTIRWATDAYPGVHKCTWAAFGPDGNVVGQETSEVDSLSEGARHPIPIGVSGPTMSAQVSCDPERLDTPAAYEVTDPRVVPELDPLTGDLIGAEVAFVVSWPEGIQLPDYPGSNACAVRITRPSGELVTVYRFSMGGAIGGVQPGHQRTPFIELSQLGSVSADEISSLGAEMTCEPFTGSPDQVG